MKLKIEYIAAGALLALLLFKAAKNRKASTAQGQAGEPIETSADWWTYAGQWGG